MAQWAVRSGFPSVSSKSQLFQLLNAEIPGVEQGMDGLGRRLRSQERYHRNNRTCAGIAGSSRPWEAVSERPWVERHRLGRSNSGQFPRLWARAGVEKLYCLEYSRHRLLKLGPLVLRNFTACRRTGWSLSSAASHELRLPDRVIGFRLPSARRPSRGRSRQAAPGDQQVLSPGGVVIIVGEHESRLLEGLSEACVKFSPRPYCRKAPWTAGSNGPAMRIFPAYSRLFPPDTVQGDHYTATRNTGNMFLSQGSASGGCHSSGSAVSVLRAACASPRRPQRIPSFSLAMRSADSRLPGGTAVREPAPYVFSSRKQAGLRGFRQRLRRSSAEANCGICAASASARSVCSSWAAIARPACRREWLRLRRGVGEEQTSATRDLGQRAFGQLDPSRQRAEARVSRDAAEWNDPQCDAHMGGGRQAFGRARQAASAISISMPVSKLDMMRSLTSPRSSGGRLRVFRPALRGRSGLSPSMDALLGIAALSEYVRVERPMARHGPGRNGGRSGSPPGLRLRMKEEKVFSCA